MSEHEGSGGGALDRTVTIVAYCVAPVGGMERALYELACGLLAIGYHVHVIARRCELDLAHPGVSWTRVRGPDRPSALAEPWFYLAATPALRRHRTGVVHVLGALVGGRADLATVQFCHAAFQAGFHEPRRRRNSPVYAANEYLSKWFGRWLETRCYRPGRTRRLVAVSSGVQRELFHFYPAMAGRIAVVPNAVDAAVFRPSQDARRRIRTELSLDGPMALFVGGDWARKGLRHAIAALTGAPGWQLVVVGEGDRAGHEELAGELGVRDRVRFAGQRSDTSPYFAAADAFVLPTAYEAHPLVMLEAAASGCPLLISSANGVTELVQDGVNGWLIDRDGESIARRLRELTASPELAARMSEAAIASVQALTWERVTLEYDAIYRSLSEAP